MIVPPCELLGVALFFCPEGAETGKESPGGGNPACGVGPGDSIRMRIRQALKGRNKILDHTPVVPSRAWLFSSLDPVPRALPWAGMVRPLRGKFQEAQHQNLRRGDTGGSEGLFDRAGMTCLFHGLRSSESF